MFHKNIIILIFIIMACLIVGLGYIFYQQNNIEKYNLMYNVDGCQNFNYDIFQSIKPNDEDITMHIDMNVTDIGNGTNITMIQYAAANTEVTNSSYNLTMDHYGNIVNFDTNGDFIPEIRPELPIRIIYPNVSVSDGSIWTHNFNRNNSYISSNSIVEYTLMGSTKYYCAGRQMIKTQNGNIDCVLINSDTNFKLLLNTTSPGSNTSSITEGMSDGSNWVDIKNGFLVKGVYNQNQTIRQDYSNIYKNSGVINSYTLEVPMDEYITINLTSIKM